MNINPAIQTLFAVLLVFFTSCGSGEKNDELLSSDETAVPQMEESRFNAQNVFNSLPDKNQVMSLIEANRIEYNPDLLNDPNAVKKYGVEFYKAANLGIYGSDLIISSSFDQTQESMVFLKCVNVLAQALGVSVAFDQRLWERIEANNNNKDSVLEIVTGAFKKVDEILKYNNRPGTSAVILAGCWIEGLYVSSRIAETINEEKTIKAIVQQKESLKNLIVMVESVKLDPSATFLLEDLKKLYEQFNVAEAATKHDKESIAQITSQITSLRTKLTDGQQTASL
jgi:hypothetical protein